jgi:hypothetical protein
VEQFTSRYHPGLPSRIPDENQPCRYCGKPMTHVMDADPGFYGFEEIMLCEEGSCIDAGNWHLPVFAYEWELGLQGLRRFAEREGHTAAPK